MRRSKSSKKRFRVTVTERASWTMSKIFKADSPEEAKKLALRRTDLDGWDEEGSKAGESDVTSVEEV